MIDRWAGRTDVELIVQHHSTVCTRFNRTGTASCTNV